MPNVIKIQIYRHVFGAKIGNKVKIGFGAILIFESLDIGDFSYISSFCIIHSCELKLGKRVRIGMFTRISTYGIYLDSSTTIGSQVSILASLENPQCKFSAGAESWIFDYCYINPERAITLGRNVGVGGGSYIFAHGLWLSKLKGYPVNFGEVNIGNDVWLPWGCFIMPGISIGDGAVVGARSVVTKNIPAGALAAGVPAKILKEVSASEVSSEIKIQILEDATRDFCKIMKLTLNVDRQLDWLYYEINGIPEIAVATRSNVSYDVIDKKNILLVIHDALPKIEFFDKTVYSLSNFQSSPRSALDKIQMAWLVHLRSIGTRYYPIDEVEI